MKSGGYQGAVGATFFSPPLVPGPLTTIPGSAAYARTALSQAIEIARDPLPAGRQPPQTYFRSSGLAANQRVGRADGNVPPENGGGGGGNGTRGNIIQMNGRTYASLEEMASEGRISLEEQLRSAERTTKCSLAVSTLLSVVGGTCAAGMGFAIGAVPLFGAAYFLSRALGRRYTEYHVLRHALESGDGYWPLDLTKPEHVHNWLKSMAGNAAYYTETDSSGMGGGAEAGSMFRDYIKMGLAVTDSVTGRKYNFIALMGIDTIAPYHIMAAKSHRGANLLRELAEHNEMAGNREIISDIEINWAESELNEQKTILDCIYDIVEWLASKGNESVLRWILRYANAGNTSAIGILARLRQSDDIKARRLLGAVLSSL